MNSQWRTPERGALSPRETNKGKAVEWLRWIGVGLMAAGAAVAVVGLLWNEVEALLQRDLLHRRTKGPGILLIGVLMIVVGVAVAFLWHSRRPPRTTGPTHAMAWPQVR